MTFMSEFDFHPIFVTPEKTEMVRKFLNKINDMHFARSVIELRAFAEAIGVIKVYPELRTLTGTKVPPSIILKEGLKSAKRLKEEGKPHTAWGQNSGDGIYTIGQEGWGGDLETWGSNVYEVKMQNAAILRGNNPFASMITSIYYHMLERDQINGGSFDKTGPTPGLPRSFLMQNAPAKPRIYYDLGLVGLSDSLEILIRTQHIPPELITQVK